MLRSTYREQRNLLVAFTAGNTRGSWIKHRLSIHQESILMVTVRQRYLEEPPTVPPPFHGKRGGIPVIEIAGKSHRFRPECSAVEIDRFDHISDGIRGAVRICM